VVGLARSISCHPCRGEFALFEPGPSEALDSMLRQRPYDDWRSGTPGTWYEVSVYPDTEDLVTVAPTGGPRSCGSDVAGRRNTSDFAAVGTR
jgi:hypothetical protein